MSRIGRLPVAIPEGVTVEIAENNKVTVTGPKGTLVKELPVEMEIKVEGEEVVVTRPSDLKKMKALHFMHPAPLYCLRYQTQPTTFQRHSLRSEANCCLFSIAQIMLPFTTRNG